MSITRVVPSSQARPWRKAFTANYDGSFPTINPDFAASQQGGRPTMAAGQALIDFGSNVVPSKVHLMLFGSGSDDQTVKARVWGFRACAGGFIGTLLWAGTGTLSATTGTDGFDVVSTDRYCDLYSTTAASTQNTFADVMSPGSDIPGRASFLTTGCEFLVVELDKDSATDVNALIGEE